MALFITRALKPLRSEARRRARNHPLVPRVTPYLGPDRARGFVAKAWLMGFDIDDPEAQETLVFMAQNHVDRIRQ